MEFNAMCNKKGIKMPEETLMEKILKTIPQIELDVDDICFKIKQDIYKIFENKGYLLKNRYLYDPNFKNKKRLFLKKITGRLSIKDLAEIASFLDMEVKINFIEKGIKNEKCI
jgi:hypothetical protein